MKTKDEDQRMKYEAMSRLRRCLRFTTDLPCCGIPMVHGTIALGRGPITACLECGAGLPRSVRRQCGIADHYLSSKEALR